MINKSGGLDGLHCIWLALLILWMVITPPLTPKVRFEPKTIDPKNKRFEPMMTMHYYTTIDPNLVVSTV
jgi:hypothetical protein